MDTLILTAFVLAVVALAFWVFTVFAIAYTIYRYVFTPWKVLRADITALHQRLAAAESALNQARVHAMNDAETARIEARLNARQRVRMSREGI